VKRRTAEIIFFLLGDAGMGKTSALLMLHLSHICSFWPKSYKSKLLKLGTNSTSEINSINAPANTILLLDALDEDRSAWNKTESFIFRLIRETINFKKVIITCRTQFFPLGQRDLLNRAGMLVIHNAFTCPVMYLSLFNDKQVKQYLSKKFSKQLPSGITDIDRQKIKSAINILDKLHNLKFRPLLLSYIDDIIEANISTERLYDIYDALVTLWLQRECQKMEELKMPMLEKACRYAAYEMQKGKDGRTLSEGQIEQLKRNYPEIELLHRLEIGGRSLLNRNSDGEFRFSHYTIQEFIIAKGIRQVHFTKYTIANLKMTDMVKTFLQSIEYQHHLHNENSSIPGITFDELDSCDLSINGCNMVFSKIHSCNLRSLDISASNLYNNILVSVTVEKAYISESCLDSSHIYDSKFPKSKMKDVTLKSARIERCDFKSASFYSCDFSSSEFRDCDFNGCTFHNIDFRYVNLNGSNIEGAIFISCLNMNWACLRGCKNWEKAKLAPEIMLELKEAKQ
jgi:uncharacterized protein YjbI with pentapeptide repeats